MTDQENEVACVGDVPVCVGCGLASHVLDTGLCHECFNRRNGWQGGGQIRVVTSAGTYHETAECPAVQQSSVWWHWKDEVCMHSELSGNLSKCRRCHNHTLFGLDNYSGTDAVIGHV